MSNSTRWLSFYGSSLRLLLPPNNRHDGLTNRLSSSRGFFRAVVSVVFLMLMTIFVGHSSLAQELILNQGFESKLAGWQSNKSPIRTVAATNPVKSGTYAAHINNASQDNEYFFQNLNASPFGQYTFSVWAMTHNVFKYSAVGVNVYDANWQKITAASFSMEVNSTSYQKYIKTFTVPGNARYLQVFGYTEWTVLKVDDFSLTQSVGGTPTGTLTKNCKIENFRKCDGTNVGYGPWLNILINGAGNGVNNEYKVDNLTWQEFSDNTATVKGSISKKNDPTVAFSVDIFLSGKTTSGTGHFSNDNNNSFCVSQKGADWYFYPKATGKMIGTGSSVLGSQINVTLDPSMPWQVGTGGAIRFKNSFGSSAWVDLCVVKQPTTGKVLSIGSEGTDFYLEMPGCTPQICSNVTSGGSIGSNQSGCGSFDPAPFTSVTDPSGGSGALEIIWMKSTTSNVLTTATASQWTVIQGANGLTYDSGPITQTTYFIRCSRRAGCSDYVGEANVITVTVQASCLGKDPVCLSRKAPVQNNSFCGDATQSYSLWFADLKGNVASPSQFFTLKSGELTEFCDGTAVLNLTACVTGGGTNDCITATVNYSGRTGTPPTGSPVSNTHCNNYTPNVSDWYYYPVSNGTFSGTGIYAGLAGSYTQNMGAFQVGTGGSLNDIAKFGASSWFKINITNGGTNNWSTVSKDGDFNFNLGTSTPIASVTATANPNAICKGSNVALTATLDVASKSANCSPSYSWVGSNGFTSTQATVTNTNVQGATTYTVTVTFTAVNGSKCSVTATTSVALKADCCDNVTNGGQIAGNQRNCGPFNPAPFTNVTLPSGGSGTLEYIWLRSTTASTFTPQNANEWIPIVGSNSATLDLNNISQTTYFQRCSRRSGCVDYVGETNIVTVIIDPIPATPASTTPGSICGTGTVTLGAVCTSGVAQWYGASTGGSVLATEASFTTPSLSATTSYFVSCKSSAGCESSRVEVKATVNSGQSAPSVTPGSICGTGTVTLGAVCSSGVAQWYGASTGGSVLATGASFTTPSLSATTSYFVSCKSSAGCESSRVEVKVTVIAQITDGGKIQADESICSGKTPAKITSVTPASGGDATLAIEYIWLQTTSLTTGSCPLNIVGQNLYTEIPNSNTPDYQPGSITQTTCYIRCARRAGCTDYIGGESNTVKKTVLANCQGKDPVCLSRKTPVLNTLDCNNSVNYGLYFADLKGNVPTPSQTYSVKSGEFTEFCDGSAILSYTACVNGGGANDCINVLINYSGRTGTPPAGSPVSNTHCSNYTPNVSDWYYYPVSNGTFSGTGIYAGLSGTYTQNMGAFQVGTGGSLNEITKFGASSWFKINITNGGTNNWSSASKDGDININLGTSTPIASVAATANPNAICSGGDVSLNAVIDAASKSSNCSPSYSWVGSNGFTSTQATVTNTNVTASTTYTVTVTFTAVNGSKCSVMATTGVTINSASSTPSVTPGSICGTGTVSLGAVCSSGVAQWYGASTGGSVLATGASFTTPSLSATTSYFVSCKSSAGCESSRVEVKATVNSGQSAPSVTPGSICGTGTVTLGAVCSSGVAQWYGASTGGSVLATGASFTTPSLSATTSYFVSCKSSAGCESSRVEVKVTVIAQITDGGKIQSDETLCGAGIPSKITSVSLPSGGSSSAAIEYLWLQTTSLSNGACPLNIAGQNVYTAIPNSNSPDYQPGAITQTTCYIRCSRRAGCVDYPGESNVVKKTVSDPFTVTPSTNPNAVCSGTTVSITLTTTATGTVSYKWVGPNGFTANTKDVTITNATTAANGIYTVTVSNGNSCSAVATVHVKVVNCLKIGDLVFNDKNNNGKQDAGELGIAGVTVRLLDSANNPVGSPTTTDANGLYSFNNLPAGTYVVEITAPTGFKSSTGTNGSATGIYEPANAPATNVNNEDNGTTVSGQIIRSKPVALTNTDNTNVDFGLFKPAKIGDTVFRDLNGDGKQDAGEGGVAGVTVKLFDSANNVVATTTTDANGKYVFDNLIAGNYTVEFVKSTIGSGFNFSPKGTTTPDKDSDADPTTGKTGIITLTEGQTNNDIDAGVTTPCDIDTEKPVLSACPYDVIIKTRGNTAIVGWTAPTATDNCGAVVTSTHQPGSEFPVGTTTVTYTATDAKGNKTTCSFVVNIVKVITCDVDTQAPVFYDCPQNVTISVKQGTPAVVYWDHPSVGDNCGIPSVTYNFEPGSVFPLGETEVIYTARDAKGNVSYCKFKVIVSYQAVLRNAPTTTETARIAAPVAEEISFSDNVTIYPNPSSSDCSIELSSELMRANSSVEVSILSAAGNVEFNQTATGKDHVSIKVPVQNMNSGTYFVNVGLDNGRMIIKKLQIVK